MIKNLIFDMGGVLIDYNPEKIALKFFGRKNAPVVLKEIFRNQLWSDKDRGIITPDEIAEKLKGRVPAEAYELVCEMVHNYYPYMQPFEKMCDMIQKLKENGYGIYLLSNASEDFYIRRRGIPALAYFDGEIISSDYKLLKPEKEIYYKLFEKYSLVPEECYFIDDVQKNIDGAKAVGMDGHCYSHGDIEVLKAALREAGVNI